MIDRCMSCGETVEDCRAEQAAIQDQNEQGACDYGPDCDGTKCRA